METDWRRLAGDLARADARRQAESEAAALGLTGSQRDAYVAALLQAQDAHIAKVAAEHIGNVLEVVRWERVACPRCASAQWLRVERSALGGEVAGRQCAGCGKWLDERNWQPAAVEEVYAPPDEEDEEPEEEDDDVG